MTITEEDTEKLMLVIKEFYVTHDLKWPTTDQAFRFVIEELGELARDMNDMIPGWKRNNPRKLPPTSDDIADEIGDAIMMLMVLGMTVGVNPLESLYRKMSRSKL